MLAGDAVIGIQWLFATVLVFVVFYLPWRLSVLLRLRHRDRRWFLGFWLWPPLWFLLENLVPLSQSPDLLFGALEIAFALCTGLDFFYYYGLTTPHVRRQVRSGLCLIPCLLVGFRDRLVPPSAAGLAPPHYGDALIWTDRLWRPQTYYFIDPDSKVFQPYESQADDPNYGKAVFAPLDGRLLRVDEDGFAHIEGGGRWRGVRVALGPLVAGSVRVGVGRELVQHQPLGLAASASPIPGIQLRLVRGGHMGFQDCYSGRWLATRYRLAFPKRNHHLQSDAAARFRVFP